MTESGAGFAEALEEAQALGYAEADPTADVEGFDAAAKAAILAGLAFHTTRDRSRRAPRGHHRGDRRPTSPAPARWAASSSCSPSPSVSDGRPQRRRAGPPGDDPEDPPAGQSCGGAFNAVFVECEAAGELMFYGQGAGGAPTASAVLGDLVAVARHKVTGGRGPGESPYADLPVRPMGDTPHALPRQPRRGRPRRRARAGRDGVRRARGVDRDRAAGRSTAATTPSWSSSTHQAPDAALAATVEALRGLDVVRGVLSVMRVEGQ